MISRHCKSKQATGIFLCFFPNIMYKTLPLIDRATCAQITTSMIILGCYNGDVFTNTSMGKFKNICLRLHWCSILQLLLLVQTEKNRSCDIDINVDNRVLTMYYLFFSSDPFNFLIYFFFAFQRMPKTKQTLPTPHPPPKEKQ